MHFLTNYLPHAVTNSGSSFMAIQLGTLCIDLPDQCSWNQWVNHQASQPSNLTALEKTLSPTMRLKIASIPHSIYLNQGTYHSNRSEWNVTLSLTNCCLLGRPFNIVNIFLGLSYLDSPICINVGACQLGIIVLASYVTVCPAIHHQVVVSLWTSIIIKCTWLLSPYTSLSTYCIVDFWCYSLSKCACSLD